MNQPSDRTDKRPGSFNLAQYQSKDRSIDLLQALFNEALDAIAIANDAGTYIDVNPAACELFGLSRDELLGRNISNFAEPGFDFTLAWRGFLEQGRVKGVFRLRRPDGTVRETEFAATANVVPHCHLSILRDITERKQADMQIHLLNADLEQRVIERTKLLSLANEELRQEIQERKRAEVALHLQTQRERLMVGIAQHIRQSLDLQEILNTTVQEVRQFLVCDRVLIYRTHSDGTGSVITEALAPGCSAILGQPLPKEVFPQEFHQIYCQGRIRTVTDVECDEMSPCLADMLRQIGVKSKMVVPIVHGEALWGLLIAHQCGQSRQWQPWEVDLLSSLATQVAIAIQQAELYSQLEAELRERTQIQQERDRFFNLSLDMLMIGNLDGDFVYVNPAWEATLGFTSQELTTQCFLKWVHPADRAATQVEMEKLAAGITVQSFENRFRCRDGSYKWLSWTAVPFLEERLVYCVARDVTARKRMEEELRESQQKYQTLFEILPIGISMTDAQGNLMEANPSSEKILGLSIAEHNQRQYDAPEWLTFRPDGTVMPASELASVKALTENRIVDNRTVGIAKPNGEIAWLKVTAAPLPLPGYGVAIAYMDITERKLADQALQESEERFRATFEQAAVGICHCSLEGQFLKLNQKFCDLVGYTQEEMLNHTWMDITYPEDLKVDLDYVRRVRAREIETYLIEKRYIRQDGSIIWVNLTGSFVYQSSGEPKYAIAVIEDISDRKRMEQALRESQLKYQTLFEILPIGISITDKQGNLIEANPASEKILGVSITERLKRDPKSKIKNLQASEFIHGDNLKSKIQNPKLGDKDALKKLVGEHRNGGAEEPGSRGAGEPGSRGAGEPGSQGAGEPGSGGAGELEELEFLSSITGAKRSWSVPKWQIIRTDGTPMPRAEFASIRALTENRAIENHESGLVKPNGEITWLSGTAAPIPIANYGAVVAFVDITEHKQIEEKLRQSEFKLKEAQRIAHIGSWEFDINTQKITGSEETFRIFGLEPDPSEPNFTEPLHQQIHPDDVGLWQTTVEQAIVNHQPYEIEFRILRPDGSMRYAMARGEALVNQQGQAVRLFGTILDISDAYRQATQRKQAEIALQQQVEREHLLGQISQRIRQSLKLSEILQTTVNEVREFLQTDRVIIHRFRTDGSGQIVVESLAPGWISTLKWTLSDPWIIDRQFQQQSPSLSIQAIEDVCAAGLAQHHIQLLKSFQVKAILVVPIQVGKKLWGLLIAHHCQEPRRWQQWEIDLLSSLANRISIAIQQSELYRQLEVQLTELQQTQAALQQAKLAAEVASRAKSEFLANMSHELRTPLNGILGYTQLLKKDTNLTDRQQNNLSIIQQCGEHLLTLIEDILDLSKIEAQKIELMPTEFHFPNFLQCIADLFRIRAEQKDISFIYEAVSPLPQGVIADPKRLRQVLINLLSNAVKFTNRGRVTFKVGYLSNLQSLADGQRLMTNGKGLRTIRFQVEDTGIGIPPRQVAEIFLPFHQVCDRTHSTEGTGLGLAITQKLVQLMDSKIHVRSTLGEGSIFWFDVDFPEVAGCEEASLSQSIRYLGFKGRKRKVLIVDDNPVNRSFLRQLLEPLGLDVLEAVNGQDGLYKAVEFQPDLILMDLVMPGLNGFEATRQLRQLPQFKNVATIAMSANVFESTKQESLAAGCQDFLPKPVQAEHLLDAIRVHLGIEGIYQESQSSSTVDSSLSPPPLVPPPPSELTVLYKLVKMGDITGILDQVNQLEKFNTKFVAFATQVRQLVQGFKLKELRGIIENYLQEN
ncbi:MAG: PAS domain S-box protein [Cyanobacteriota bacterium]